MAHFANFLTAGLAIALAYDLVLAPGAMDQRLRASGGNLIATASAASDSSSSLFDVNRARKGDRFRGAEMTSERRTEVAKVEISADGAVALRDRSGATVFGIDPEARRTIIAKNVVLPQLTIQSPPQNNPVAQTPSAMEKPVEPPKLRPAISPDGIRTTTVGGDGNPEPQRPNGCDPSFSPITAPQLGHIFGRCVTSLDAPTRMALAQ